MEIEELVERSDREEAVPILRELWSDRDHEAILAWTAEEDQHVFGAFEDGILLGVASVRIDDFLHHERHAWLYSFVVERSRRGEGVGTALLEHVETWARERDCERIALATPLAKESAQEYYENRGFETWGYLLEMDC